MRSRIKFGMTPSFLTKETKPLQFCNSTRFGSYQIKTKPLQFCNSARFRWFPIKAFTLAEMLITLAIIGIIAALTIPNLMRNYQRAELESRFKVAYKKLNDGIAKMYRENGDELVPYTYALSNDTDQKKFMDTFSKYLGKNIKSATYKLMEKENLSYASLYTYKPIYDYNSKTPVALHSKYVKIIDGQFDIAQLYATYVNYGAYNTLAAHVAGIIVDTNTFSKPPNRWGYDIFMFQLAPDKKILVPDGSIPHYGHERFKCGNKGASKNNVDYGCAQYAILNQCPNDTSKKYWECLKL